MRKSTVIAMTIILVGFGSLLFAAGAILRPLARDAEIAKELTNLLRHRGDLATDTRVRCIRRKASAERLADVGQGLVVRLQPSDAVLARRHGLRSVAVRAAQEAWRQVPDGSLDWIEVVFSVGEKGEARTLLTANPDGRVLGPAPAPPEPADIEALRRGGPWPPEAPRAPLAPDPDPPAEAEEAPDGPDPGR